MKVSVIIPTKNEPLLKEVIAGIKCFVKNAEIIVVDKSVDKTPNIAKKMNVKLIRQNGNGFGDACLLGANKANGDILVFIDGDGTYSPKNINGLISPIRRGESDYVLGNRFINLDKKSMNAINNFGNKFLTFLANKLYDTQILDSQTGLRAIKKKAFEKMCLNRKNFDFYTQMNIEAKKKCLSISQVPVKYFPRKGSKTKLNPLSDGFRIACTTIRLISDFNPFMVFGTIGLILLLFGLFLGSSLVIEYFNTSTISRMPSVILSSLLILSGLVFSMIALIMDLILKDS